METRESLLQNLYEAQGIIQQAEEITQRYNDTKAKLLNRQVFVNIENRTSTKVKNTIGGVIAAILFGFMGFIALILFAIARVLNDSSVMRAAVVWLVIFIVGILLYVIHLVNQDKWYKQVNKSGQMAVQAENERRAKINAQIEQEAEVINAEMQEIRHVADEKLAWYPRSYCYSEAVIFFIDAIQNFRADSLKEAINLYVQELQHQQVLQKQQQVLDKQQSMLAKQDESIRQQKVNNVLSAMNLFANLGTRAAVNNNTAAVNNNTAAVNALGSFIRNH